MHIPRDHLSDILNHVAFLLTEKDWEQTDFGSYVTFVELFKSCK